MNDVATPLVSIVIVTYNQQAYIAEAIEGALGQDHPKLEIIVSDDASSDGTWAIVDAYAQRYPEVVFAVRGSKNVGVTGNCNRGLALASGKYICWQGGDDIFLANKVRRQVEWMEADSRRSVCYHDADVFDSETGVTLWKWSDRFRMRTGDAATVIRYGTFMCAPTVMFRRDHLPQNLCDERVKVASDWLLVIETLEHSGGQIGCIDGIFTRYRRHASNLSASDSHRLADALATLDIVSNRYPKHAFSVRQQRAEAHLIEAWHRLRARDVTGFGRHLRRSFIESHGIWVGPAILLVRHALGLRL